jgi:hypothetical protein
LVLPLRALSFFSPSSRVAEALFFNRARSFLLFPTHMGPTEWGLTARVELPFSLIKSG